MEFYSALYSTKSVLDLEALNGVECLPIMHKVDNEPNIGEMEAELAEMATSKALGAVGIPPEVHKCLRGPSIKDLHDILIQCWRAGTVSQDMRDSNIVTLYKNKGNRSDCNSYCGISLLSITEKLFTHVVQKRMQALADRIYLKSQCGFRVQ